MKFPSYKTVPTASLIPYVRNARTHSPQQVDKIAASIREFGFLSPIITDGQSGIVAGHGRVMAAHKLGLDTLPTIDAAHLTEAQRRACVLAARYFPGMLLKIELQDLEAEGFDLSLTGFDLGELTVLFDNPTFAPGTEGDQGRLDELAPKIVTCPHCNAEWDLREHGQG